MTKLLLDRDFWLERSEWPIGYGGWTFLGDALDDVGKALSGDDWSGSEVNTYRSDATAFARLEKAMEWIASRCCQDDIRVAIQHSGELEISEYSQPIWNIQPAARRFRWCRFYPSAPLMDQNNTDSSCDSAFIFLSQEDLSKEIALLRHAELIVTDIDLSRYAPFLRFAVTLAQRWNLTSETGQMKGVAMKAAIKEAWEKDHFGEALYPTALNAIYQIIRFPDWVAMTGPH